MLHRYFVLFAALGLAACEHEPLEYIPPADRALLQAQARMGDGGGTQGPVSVEDMLRRARAAPDSAVPAKLVLQFSRDAVTLDDAQKQSLAQFAAAAKEKSVTVQSRRGGFDGSAALAGQRRAMAVARELTGHVAAIELRFAPDTPDDVVVVGAASPGAAP